MTPPTYAEAEGHLLALELFGMRFGLDRMRRLLTALGTPQERFASVHVVGSNGKSSTTRMIAALLSAHGERAGAYLSPHLVAFTERIRVDGEDVAPERFAAAVQRARLAALKVDRGRGEDRVTQFELVTAVAFDELAAAGVDVAVVEAGLGGRWDATNVLPSRVQVLTNVGLEHTRWLGPTVEAIAREKLDVVEPGGTLVVGAALAPGVLAIAEETAAERGARLVVAPAEPAQRDLVLAAAGTFQRRNFALAAVAAQAFLGRALDPAAVRAAAASTLVPGRFETVDAAPLTILDGAHNPAGFVVLAESLRAMLAGRRLVAVLSVLDDKDAAAMLAELMPLCAELVVTGNRNPRTLPPATLASLAAQVGAAPVRIERDPRAALALARELAGADGVALATGSLYLLADLKRGARDARASTL